MLLNQETAVIPARPALCAACALAAFVLAVPAWAQPRDAATPYPNRPVRLVVGFSAGGPSDIIGRVLAQRLSEPLGQPVLVENRPGASGNIAAESVAKAPADGYTILLAALGSASVSYALERSTLRYDLRADFAPIMIVATVPFVLVVNPTVPARSLSEFIAYAKARPGQLGYASGGANTPQRLAAEMFKLRTGIDMFHVPYKGGGQAMTDLVGGQVLTAFEAMPAALPHIKSAKLRPLAVATAQRASTLPDVPTMGESGISDYVTTFWTGVVAPTGTPAGIVDRLNAAINDGLRSPPVQEALAKVGAQPAPGSPQDFASFIAAETRKWSAIAKTSGISLD
jgi:tripartite-type tricarboxylate transporter receptor subunit TctC